MMNRKTKPIAAVRVDEASEGSVAKPDSSQHGSFGNAHAGKSQRTGFLDGEIEVPDDFDTMGGAELFTDETPG